jgi:ribonucleoside-diphosphate reductase alpha chain
MSLMSGGGIGVVYSDIREKDAVLTKTGGKASGPIPLMQIINEIGRGIMNAGERRCIPQNSLIYTVDGLIPIKDIIPGQKVYTTNGPQKVLAKLNNGKKLLWKIETNGGSLYATKDHLVATLNEKGGICWKEVQNLTEDAILLRFDSIVKGRNTVLPDDFTQVRPKGSSTTKAFSVPVLDEDVAWLLGLIHGDGYVRKVSGSSRVSIAFHKKDQKSYERAAKILKEKFEVTASLVPKEGEECVCLIVCCQRLVEYLHRYLKQPKEELCVPSFIMESTPTIRASYLAGLVDSDGCLKNRPIKLVTTIYKTFAQTVMQLAISLNLSVRLHTHTPKNSRWKTKYDVCIIGFKEIFRDTVLVHSTKEDCLSLESRCNFQVPKQVVKTLLPRASYKNLWDEVSDMSYETFKIKCKGALPGVPLRVLSCSPTDIEDQVFDLQIENVPEFYADGFLVHNCAIWSGLHWNHSDALEFTTSKDWSEDIRYMKQSDYNFPAKLDMTNISVILDDDFFAAYYKNDDKAHKVYWSAIRQMLQHSEPGFSVDVGKNKKENLRNACTEITSEDDSDVCNLGSINMARVSSLEEMKELVEIGVIFLLAGTEYSHFPTKKSEETKNKNRRLGLGLMGIHEWLLSHEYSYSPCDELEEYLKIYSTSGDFANKWADTFSLSRPLKTRAIAPVGSIGIIGETTTGIEPIFCVAYKRRYFKEGKWFYQYVVDPTAKRLIDKGVSPDKIEDSYSLAQNVEKRVAFQAWVQQYVDHAISSTINLPAWGTEYNNESLIDSFGNMLLKYLPKLRGITVYADGSRSGQPLNPVKYETAIKHVGEIVEESGDVCDISGKGGSCGG